jgi:hypothetical protein
VRLDWPSALAWRLRRYLLDPVGTGTVADVVHRLGAVADSADDLAIGVGMSGPADAADADAGAGSSGRSRSGAPST